MTKTSQKITLAVSRDVPFNKLVLSQSNVRTVKAGQSIEQLAEDIAHRGLLQSLYVRPVIDADGNETGMYEVPAGGRRYRALECLVKAKRLVKTAAVPCIVKETGIAEEDSLAENTQREALHPVDQFRAFQTLIDKGLSEEEIAARFFVTPTVVRQRLRLASVSPRLIDLYVAEEATLEQLMAFAITTDHARQEQVWDSLQHGWNKEPHYIRRVLTETAVSAGDRRAQFVGIEAYEAAGGVVTRDLFTEDDGGWLQDAALLDRLTEGKLKAEAEKLAAEGWNWIAAAIDFPYGHNSGLRRLRGEAVDMTAEEQATRAALAEEFDRLETEYRDADEYPDEVDERLGEIETLIEALDNRPVRYDPDDVARAGIFVSLSRDGDLDIDRGYVRREDEAPVTAQEGETTSGDAAEPGSKRIVVITVGGDPVDEGDEDAEQDGIKPLSDRLVAELTAHRTLALRDAVATNPAVAFQSVLHAFCLRAFYGTSSSNCMEISVTHAPLTAQAPALKDSAPAQAIETRHAEWQSRLPEDSAALWDALTDLDGESQAALFAHCAGLAVNVVREPWNRRPHALAHGDQLARAVGLDMIAAGWKPTVDNYLGRVPKARILEAVREGRNEQSAQLIDHLKKGEMAKEAERLLDDAGWLPEPLRTADATWDPWMNGADSDAGNVVDLPAYLAEDGNEDDEADQALAAGE